jgi:hypothetical protein
VLGATVSQHEKNEKLVNCLKERKRRVEGVATFGQDPLSSVFVLMSAQ